MFGQKSQTEFYYRNLLRQAKNNRDYGRLGLFLSQHGLSSFGELERLAREEDEKYKLEEQRVAEKARAEAEEAARKAAEAEAAALRAYRERQDLVTREQDLIGTVERIQTFLEGIDKTIASVEQRIVELLRCSMFASTTAETALELRGRYQTLNELTIAKRLAPLALKSAREDLAAVSKRLKKLPRE